MKLSIIIPCFNESNFIESVVQNINEQKHIKISNNYLVKRDKKNKKKKKNDINLYLENYKKSKHRNDRKMMINKELKSKNEVKKDVTFFSDDDY